MASSSDSENCKIESYKLNGTVEGIILNQTTGEIKVEKEDDIDQVNLHGVIQFGS